MIKRVQIENYRSCLSTRFEPHPHLSVLIGPNGTGKTNVLTAMTLLRKLADETDRPFRRVEESLEDPCTLKTWFEIDSQIAILSASLKTDTDEANSDRIITSEQWWNLKHFTGSGKHVKVPLYFTRFLDQPDSKNYRVQLIRGGRFQYASRTRMTSLVPEPAQRVLAQIGRQLYEMKYYSASQFTNPTRCPVSFEIEIEGQESRLSGYSHSAHTKLLNDFYIQHKSNNNTHYQEFLDIVGRNGIGLVDKIDFKEVPTSSIDYSVKSGGKLRQKKREKVLVIPQFTIGRHELSPNQLSEGTFKTITLLFYLITESSSVLLIEEPEVCVHHGLLSSILELIKTYSRDKQIVISTHSDFVLDHVAPDNVFRVSNDPDLGTKVVSVPRSMSRRDFNALRKYLDSTGNLGEYWKHGALE